MCDSHVLGCGSGRYLHINPSIFKIGSDICLPFLHSASLRGFEVISADNLLLPFRDGFFDAAISIGVIHHFASQERRVQALQELARIVCSGGLLMVYVWAFEQKYRKASVCLCVKPASCPLGLDVLIYIMCVNI